VLTGSYVEGPVITFGITFMPQLGSAASSPRRSQNVEHQSLVARRSSKPYTNNYFSNFDSWVRVVCRRSLFLTAIIYIFALSSHVHFFTARVRKTIHGGRRSKGLWGIGPYIPTPGMFLQTMSAFYASAKQYPQVQL
jgi:hypothetical protein